MKALTVIVVGLLTLFTPPALAPAARAAEPPETPLIESPIAVPAILLSLDRGPGNELWLQSAHPDLLGHLNAHGLEQIPTPPAPAKGWNLLHLGPWGLAWFGGHSVGLMASDGRSVEYPRPPWRGQPGQFALGPAGDLYYSLSSLDRSGRRAFEIDHIAPDGTATRLRFAPHGAPGGLAIGPDGNLWFTERAAVPRIGRLTPSGALARFPLPRANREPGSIIAGPDGALWFTATRSHPHRDPSAPIGRITTAGEISEFAVPGAVALSDLTVGPEGALWFIAEAPDTPRRIGSISTEGAPGRLICMDPGCQLDAEGLALGIDGRLWAAASLKLSIPGGGGASINRILFAEAAGSVVGPLAPAAGTAIWAP
jgi:virginiamycin B lyase